MDLGNAIALSSVVSGFCGVVITAIFRFTGNKKSNGALSEKVFREYQDGMKVWRTGIDNKISKIFDILDKMRAQ